MKRKTVAILMAAMLICGGAAGATMAWLTDSTATIRNTFTAGDVKIKLTEANPTETKVTATGEEHFAKMVPGTVIEKNPKITVEKGSEPCYVFVKITPSSNYEDFFGKVNVAQGWTKLNDISDGTIYYSICGVSGGVAQGILTDDVELYILQGNDTYANGCVTVRKDVRKADMASLNENTYPHLSFQAYAVQYENVEDVEEAWKQVPSTEPTT